jgi:hypothetical protein
VLLLRRSGMELLIRHLVCWHSNVSHNSRRRVVSPAAPHLSPPRHLSWVLAYIDAPISAVTSLSAISRSWSAFPNIISFATFARRLRERLMPIWSIAASPRAVDALRYSPMSIERIARGRFQERTRIFQRVQKNAVKCRQASSRPGHAERRPHWLCLLPGAPCARA